MDRFIANYDMSCKGSKSLSEIITVVIIDNYIAWFMGFLRKRSAIAILTKRLFSFCLRL